MKLTKFQHACFVIEKDGVSVVVDPGNFTQDFIMPKKVSAVFVSHSHPDHADNKLVTTILRENPKAILLAHESVTANFDASQTQTVTADETVQVGPMTLKFVGGTHETIDESMPVPPNLGVIIDERLYYPGDSFYVPQQKVQALALTVSAPWLKISETLNFLRAIKPAFAFPTHDAILSNEGQGLVDRIIGNVAEDLSVNYQRINGKTIELL